MPNHLFISNTSKSPIDWQAIGWRKKRRRHCNAEKRVTNRSQHRFNFDLSLCMYIARQWPVCINWLDIYLFNLIRIIANSQTFSSNHWKFDNGIHIYLHWIPENLKFLPILLSYYVIKRIIIRYSRNQRIKNLLNNQSIVY